MKILMVLPSIGRSSMLTGTPAHVIKLSRGLRELGINVRIFECRETKRKDVQVNVTSSLWTVWFKLFFEILTNRPNLIHAHTHEAALISLFFSKIFRIKMIYECHGIPRISSAKKFRSGFLNKAEKFVISHSDALICQAKAMEKRMKGIRPNIDNCLVIYPGIRLHEFQPLKQFEYANDNKNIVYLGTSQVYQGLSLLAESQKYIATKNVIFNIYLSDGTSEKVKKSLDFDWSHTNIIDLHDSEKIPEILRGASLLVHARPNVPDNYNVQSKLGLYLASGRPIVTTLVGDYIDILKNYRGALMVEDEANELARAIDEVLNNQKYGAAAKSEGFEWAKKYFDTSENSMKLLKFYKEILS